MAKDTGEANGSPKQPKNKTNEAGTSGPAATTPLAKKSMQASQRKSAAAAVGAPPKKDGEISATLSQLNKTMKVLTAEVKNIKDAQKERENEQELMPMAPDYFYPPPQFAPWYDMAAGGDPAYADGYVDRDAPEDDEIQAGGAAAGNDPEVVEPPNDQDRNENENADPDMDRYNQILAEFLAPQETVGDPIKPAIANAINKVFKTGMDFKVFKNKCEEIHRPRNAQELRSKVEVDSLINTHLKHATKTFDERLCVVQSSIAKAGCCFANVLNGIETGTSADDLTELGMKGFAMLGHGFHNLCLRRRELQKPDLQSKFANVFAPEVEHNAYLYGGNPNVERLVKEINTSNQLFRQPQTNSSYPGRGGRPMRRPNYSRGSRMRNRGGRGYRHTPYPMAMQYPPMRGGFAGGYDRRGRGKSSSVPRGEKMSALTETHVFNGSLDHFAPGLDGRLIHHNAAKCEDAVVPPGMMGVPTSSGNMNRKMLCQVCGALSSGLHFGVFTCEGCKCFYRRSIKEGANYACAKERNCEITMETRNSCRYCRFQKCLALGMSKEGIKLGRRPKVDSDAFQHGFYPPGDMDYHTHAYWAHMEHQYGGFKTEPIYAESGDEMARERIVYGEVGGLNYAMKPEPFCHGHGQVTGHFGHDGYGDGQNGHHHPQDGRLAVYQHPPMCMPPEAYTEQSQSHHLQGAQLQQWPSELSPTASASGSEDNWEANSPVGMQRAPSSVSLTLPEVQSGAAAALAYANLYRGKNDGDEKVQSSHNEGVVHNGQSESAKSNSISYTELQPRRTSSPPCSRNQLVAMHHQDLKSKYLHSPTQGGAGSVSPHHTKANEGRSSPWTLVESTTSGTKRKSQVDKMADNAGGKSQRMVGRERMGKSEQLRRVQELMDNFLPLEKVVTYQWQAYLQSYGEQTYSNQPRYKDPAHLTAFLKTHGEEVFYQIRKFAANLPGFDELSQTQKDSLLHCTAPSIITTCLLQSECGTCDGDKLEKGSVTSIDEGACFCAVLLLMAGKKQQSLTNDLCSKLSLILEDYINETLTRRDPEKLQGLLQQLYNKTWQEQPHE